MKIMLMIYKITTIGQRGTMKNISNEILPLDNDEINFDKLKNVLIVNKIFNFLTNNLKLAIENGQQQKINDEFMYSLIILTNQFLKKPVIIIDCLLHPSEIIKPETDLTEQVENDQDPNYSLLFKFSDFINQIDKIIGVDSSKPIAEIIGVDSSKPIDKIIGVDSSKPIDEIIGVDSFKQIDKHLVFIQASICIMDKLAEMIVFKYQYGEGLPFVNGKLILEQPYIFDKIPNFLLKTLEKLENVKNSLNKQYITHIEKRINFNKEPWFNPNSTKYPKPLGNLRCDFKYEDKQDTYSENLPRNMNSLAKVLIFESEIPHEILAFENTWINLSKIGSDSVYSVSFLRKEIKFYLYVALNQKKTIKNSEQWMLNCKKALGKFHNSFSKVGISHQSYLVFVVLIIIYEKYLISNEDMIIENFFEAVIITYDIEDLVFCLNTLYEQVLKEESSPSRGLIEIASDFQKFLNWLNDKWRNISTKRSNQ